MLNVTGALLTALVLIATARAQSPPVEVILDVKASGYAIEPFGEHVYLRVYANGHIAFDDFKPSINGFYLYERQISQVEIASLETKIRAVSQMSESHYALKSPFNKTARVIKITLAQSNRFQTLEFTADHSLRELADSNALAELVCAIERLRGNARIWVVDQRRCRAVK